MKGAVIFGVMVLVLCSVRMANGQTEPAAYTDADAYEIYSLLLQPENPATEKKPRKLVIQIETEDYPNFGDDKTKCLVAPKDEEAIYAPVIEAYHKANETRWRLQPKFGDSIFYELVSEDLINGFFKKGGGWWQAFYKKYPASGGYITMSAVGYNADKTIAIVYAGHSCGGLCGGGSYRVLKKSDGKWSEIPWKGTVCTWVS